MYIAFQPSSSSPHSSQLKTSGLSISHASAHPPLSFVTIVTMPLPAPLGLHTAAKLGSALLPAFFVGTIFGYNYILIPPILRHSDERVLAKQWLQAYQFGARYVRPLVQTTTACNAYLVYLAVSRAPTSGMKETLVSAGVPGYIAALFSLPLLMAYTLGVMEPGINGALKAKVEKLVGKEEAGLKRDSVPVGEGRETATPATKEWSQTESLRSLIMQWKRCNDWRMVLAGLSAVVSMGNSLMYPWIGTGA